MAYMKDSAGRRLDSFAVADARLTPVPVATKASHPTDTSLPLSNGTVTSGTARISHTMTRTAYGLRLVFTNWGSGLNATEQDTNPDPITVRAAIEYPITQVFPVTFNGSRTVVIEPGGTVVSDPLGIDLLKGTLFYTRTYVEVASTKKFPLGIISTASSNEASTYGSPGTDLTNAGAGNVTGGTNAKVFAPASILGLPKDPGKPVIALLGDSIMQGVGDPSAANGGYGQRALAGNYSFQKVAHPGESLTGWNGTFGETRRRRVGLLARMGITHALTNYSVNHLVAASIKTDAVIAWRIMERWNVPVTATTLTPQTSSTDAWATVGNQTKMYPADREPRRLSFNQWMRDGAPINASDVPQNVGVTGAGIVRVGDDLHPLTNIVDVCPAVETAQDSGIWKAGMTGDGTHPNATGHAAMATLVNPAVLFGPPAAV